MDKGVDIMEINYHGVKYQWRFSKFFTHLIIIVSVLAIMISYISNVAKANLPHEKMIITVHQGDTLWSLAKKVKPNEDPRLVIRDIKTQNHLQTPDLIAGQKLRLTIGRE
jgi:LysM repeat protein